MTDKAKAACHVLDASGIQNGKSIATRAGGRIGTKEKEGQKEADNALLPSARKKKRKKKKKGSFCVVAGRLGEKGKAGAFDVKCLKGRLLIRCLLISQRHLLFWILGLGGRSASPKPTAGVNHQNYKCL